MKKRQDQDRDETCLPENFEDAKGEGIDGRNRSIADFGSDACWGKRMLRCTGSPAGNCYDELRNAALSGSGPPVFTRGPSKL
jgi:hypothetical protein